MGKKKGMAILKKRPKEYPMTPAQKHLIDANHACGISKGITRQELREKMSTCIPEYFRKLREAEDGKKTN